MRLCLPGLASALVVHVRYPSETLGSHKMFLRGSACGLSWDQGQAMTPVGADTYELALPSCGSGEHVELKPVVDDVTWAQGANSEVDVGAQGEVAEVFPWFFTGKGTVKVLKDVKSPQGLATRDVAVYLPPSFEENTLKAYSNVLIAHDGNNLFDQVQCDTCCANGCWGVDTTLDTYIAASNPGLMSEVVVVGVYNTPDRMDELTYSKDPKYGGGKLDTYLTFVEKTVMPLVAKEFPRVSAASAGPWPMMGSSLGGLATCYAGWTQGSKYSPVACMSSSFWWDGEDFKGSILAKSGPSPKQDHPFYIDWGSGEVSEQTDSNAAVVKQLQGMGWEQEVAYYIQPDGTHNEQSWGARVNKPLQLLFPPAPIATKTPQTSIFV